MYFSVFTGGCYRLLALKTRGSIAPIGPSFHTPTLPTHVITRAPRDIALCTTCICARILYFKTENLHFVTRSINCIKFCSTDQALEFGDTLRQTWRYLKSQFKTSYKISSVLKFIFRVKQKEYIF